LAPPFLPLAVLPTRGPGGGCILGPAAQPWGGAGRTHEGPGQAGPNSGAPRFKAQGGAGCRKGGILFDAKRTPTPVSKALRSWHGFVSGGFFCKPGPPRMRPRGAAFAGFPHGRRDTAGVPPSPGGGRGKKMNSSAAPKVGGNLRGVSPEGRKPHTNAATGGRTAGPVGFGKPFVRGRGGRAPGPFREQKGPPNRGVRGPLSPFVPGAAKSWGR